MTMKEPKKIRAIVIDDMKTLRKIVLKHLKEFGITDVEMAINGKEALNMAMESLESGKPYDLFLSDWNMPEMSGLKLLEKIRENDSYRETPFILISAEIKKENQEKAKAAGVTNYLNKPFSNEQLKEMLGKIFEWEN